MNLGGIMRLLFLATFLMASIHSHGQVLVFEYLDEFTPEHADMVSQVACGEFTENCGIYQFPNFHEPDVQGHVADLVAEFQVVNMSFGVTLRQRPVFDYKYDYEQELKQFEADNLLLKESFSFLENLVASHPDVLFVAASGNGEDLGMAQGNGYNITAEQPMYPALIQAANMVTVAAIDQQPGFSLTVDKVKLTDYSNYRLETVDLASPIAPMLDGSFYEGTSFAAPWVAEVADYIMSRFELTARVTKRVLLRACKVKNT